MNSAEKEIQDYSKPDSSKTWLINHGMLSEDTDTYTVNVTKDWNRPGGESFIMQFSIDQTVNNEHYVDEYISKACIKIPCAQTMEDWLTRRKILNENGIPTPKLHAVSRASLIESYVPLTIQEAFMNADEHARRTIISKLNEIYSTLFDNDFHPRILTDLRSHGDDVVVIDFGEDLGGQFNHAIDRYDPSLIIIATIGRLGLKYTDTPQ